MVRALLLVAEPGVHLPAGTSFSLPTYRTKAAHICASSNRCAQAGSSPSTAMNIGDYEIDDDHGRGGGGQAIAAKRLPRKAAHSGHMLEVEIIFSI